MHSGGWNAHYCPQLLANAQCHRRQRSSPTDLCGNDSLAVIVQEDIARVGGLKLAYPEDLSADIVDFAPIVRAVALANLVIVCS
jgi:hypothetical protein